MKPEEIESCSFCNKGVYEAEVLITEKGAGICESCILLCATILLERRENPCRVKLDNEARKLYFYEHWGTD